MKGNEKVLSTLNDLLANELAAINQYMVHSEMCEDWGYKRLYHAVKDRAFTEMRHAEKLIERILFLEGKPEVSRLERITIGGDVPKQIQNDLGYETDCVKRYNAAIKVVVEAGDNGTRDLLQKILEEEEEHVDWLESQSDLLEQTGVQNYLSEQVRKEG